MKSKKKRKKQENLNDEIVFFFQFTPKKLHDIFQFNAHSQKWSSKEIFNEHPYRSTAHILSST